MSTKYEKRSARRKPPTACAPPYPSLSVSHVRVPDRQDGPSSLSSSKPRLITHPHTICTSSDAIAENDARIPKLKQPDHPSPIRTLEPTQSQAKTNETKRWYFGNEVAWDISSREHESSLYAPAPIPGSKLNKTCYNIVVEPTKTRRILRIAWTGLKFDIDDIALRVEVLMEPGVEVYNKQALVLVRCRSSIETETGWRILRIAWPALDIDDIVLEVLMVQELYSKHWIDVDLRSVWYLDC
ncbi:hypothetical protein P692DRAFT_201811860 [Suillus brevipes Sb2]|nr:hypothetical protein P692DRAFT_201811860 [Suillus brevipes Sb2]